MNDTFDHIVIAPSGDCYRLGHIDLVGVEVQVNAEGEGRGFCPTCSLTWRRAAAAGEDPDAAVLAARSAGQS
jgi:hypothetical protein